MDEVDLEDVAARSLGADDDGGDEALLTGAYRAWECRDRNPSGTTTVPSSESQRYATPDKRSTFPTRPAFVAHIVHPDMDDPVIPHRVRCRLWTVGSITAWYARGDS